MPSIDGINYPGPYEVRLLYNTVQSGITTFHQLRVNVDMAIAADPGDPFSDWTLQSRLGTTPVLSAFVDDLVALLQPIFASSSNFTVAELWEYQTGTFNADFRSAYTVGLAGTSGSSTNAFAQAIMTIRSQNGGHVRATFMQPVSAVAVTDPYPFAISAYNDIADFYVATDSPILARDGGYLFSPLNLLIGRNEKLEKDFYRP